MRDKVTFSTRIHAARYARRQYKRARRVLRVPVPTRFDVRDPKFSRWCNGLRVVDNLGCRVKDLTALYRSNSGQAWVWRKYLTDEHGKLRLINGELIDDFFAADGWRIKFQGRWVKL